MRRQIKEGGKVDGTTAIIEGEGLESQTVLLVVVVVVVVVVVGC